MARRPCRLVLRRHLPHCAAGGCTQGCRPDEGREQQPWGDERLPHRRAQGRGRRAARGHRQRGTSSRYRLDHQRSAARVCLLGGGCRRSHLPSDPQVQGRQGGRQCWRRGDRPAADRGSDLCSRVHRHRQGAAQGICRFARDVRTAARAAAALGRPGREVAVTAGVCGLVAVRHWSNIKRLISGEEGTVATAANNTAV